MEESGRFFQRSGRATKQGRSYLAAPPGARRGKKRHAPPGRPQLTQATRSALFILGEAIAAGFELRVAGHGRLEVVGPVGVDPALCEPTVEAIRNNGAEILRLICWFAAEERQGRFWSPRLGPEARQ